MENHTDPNVNYGAQAWRQPDIAEGDTVLYSECGRIMDHTDYRSHWYMLVKPRIGFYTLLVKHGGGQERITLTYSDHIARALGQLDSDARYFMLHTLHDSYRVGESVGYENGITEYRRAFVDGRLKKRKERNSNRYKVFIEPVRVVNT